MRTSRERLTLKPRYWWSGALAGLGLSLFLLPGQAMAQITPTEQVAALAPGLQAKLGPTLKAFLADRAQAPTAPTSLGIDGMAREVGTTSPSAYVILSGDVSEGELAALGVQVVTHTPFSTTAFVPLSSLAQVLALSSVEGVDSPHPMQKHLNVSAYNTGVSADYDWGKSGSPPTYSGYSGRGVIMGVIDTGLDLTHKDFQTTAGKTRVKYLWDQAGIGQPPPSGYNYGAEWTGTLLDANLAITTDIDGHGTHVTGIAAGNGQATGGTFSAYRYIGIAPQADLVIVKSILTDASIIDGVRYIFAKATAMNEDAVVLIASGNQRGAHDGGAALDQSLSSLTGPGHVIVSSVGNDGMIALHSRVNLASNGASATLTPTIPTYSPSTGEYLDVQAWHASTALFQVRVTTPSGLQSAWVQPGGTTGTVATADGAYMLANDQTSNGKGRKEIDLYTWYQGGTTARPKVGTWKLDVQRLSGSTTGQLDAWIAAWRFGSGNVSPNFTTNIDSTTTINSPATADSVIAVTAYTTRNTWPNFLGQTSFYTDNPGLQGWYEPSSRGPRLDNVQRPDVAAPGEGIVAALAIGVAGSAGNLKVDDGVHWILRGTSQAAAHIAGAAADLLQQYPHSSPSAIRNMLRNKIRSDVNNTGSVPNLKWGYGKFDFRGSATVAVGDLPKTGFGLAPAWPNPARGAVNFEYQLSAADVAEASDQGVRLDIFDARGRIVSSIQGSLEPGPQRVAWSGFSDGGFPAPAGLYLARLEVGHRSAITKFVRIAP